MGTASGDETLLWEPSEELKQQATLTRYMQWLEREKGLYVRDQEELWHWSVSHLEDFWASIWDFFSVKASRPYTSVLADRKMPGAQWFGGAELNYAEQVFRNASVGYPALLFQTRAAPASCSLVGGIVAQRGFGGQCAASPWGKAGGPGRVLHGQSPGNGDCISGLCEHRGGLVELPPGLWHEQRDRTLPTDRAQGALCRGWLPI